MKKFGWLLFVLIVLILGFSCENPAGGGPDGGPGGGTDSPITLPDSVDPNLAYASYEIEIFNAINDLRAGSEFESRDLELDALARRYAQICKVDTVANLTQRVKEANGSCTDASFVIGGSNTLDSSYVSIIVIDGDNTPLKNTNFTQIGIGMAEGVGEFKPGPPEEKWHSAVVILAKP
jgi:hypothetical protein